MPRRKASWYTEAPIPKVLRTARTPSPGGRKPPGRRGWTPYLLATPQSDLVTARAASPGGSKPPGRYRGWTPYKLVPACNATGSA